jgi:hypothetical protein
MHKEANPREISTCTTKPQTQMLVSKDHQNSEAKTKRWMKNRSGGDQKHATQICEVLKHVESCTWFCYPHYFNRQNTNHLQKIKD